jgi:hypothetical protein
MKQALVIALLLISSSVLAQQQREVRIERRALGSGTPAITNTVGIERAVPVADNYLHAPQYLPGYPTAAVIWPRVVEVNCIEDAGKLNCDGYNWRPDLGRGEYLFIVPRIAKPPQVIEKPIPFVVEREVVREILKEVPAKKLKQ